MLVVHKRSIAEPDGGARPELDALTTSEKTFWLIADTDRRAVLTTKIAYKNVPVDQLQENVPARNALSLVDDHERSGPLISDGIVHERISAEHGVPLHGVGRTVVEGDHSQRRSGPVHQDFGVARPHLDAAP